MPTKGPSFSGPTSGWTATSLAPKTNNLPISDAAVAKFVAPPGYGKVPVSQQSLAANKARLQPRIDKAKIDAATLEKKGDQASLEAALDLRKKLAVWENSDKPHNAFDLFRATIDNFKTSHPNFKVSAENQRVLGMSDEFSGVAPTATPGLTQTALGSAAEQALAQYDPTRSAGVVGSLNPTGTSSVGVSRSYGTAAATPEEAQARIERDRQDSLRLTQGMAGPTPVGTTGPGPGGVGTVSSAASSGGSAGSSDLSQYNLTNADYGASLGPDPRIATKRMTPLEQLLAQIAPDLAAGAPPDPFANPRPTGQAPSTFQNVLAGLFGQSQSGGGSVNYGPSYGGPATGAPSYGANLASSIPGAPPFLAGAINGVQGFNPYASPQPTYVAPAPKLDFGGLAQLSAEQRIQAAQMAKDKAAAQAKWFASQAKQEQINAEQANMSRLKGFSGSGWQGPALPTY